MFKVIIAGTRSFSNYELLVEKCDLFLQNITDEIEIVSGTCNGADKLGEKYASEKGFKIALFPADWNSKGKLAGIFRNKKMAEHSNALVVFWDGKSKGTTNMIYWAKHYNLKIRIIDYSEPIIEEEQMTFND